jgi:hypothetical protein
MFINTFRSILLLLGSDVIGSPMSSTKVIPDMVNTTTTNENKRSRSLLRQVRETFGGLHRSRNRTEINVETFASINRQRASIDSLDTHNLQGKLPMKKTTLLSSGHRLSLLGQMKSHLNRAPKSTSTIVTDDDDDEYTHLSLPMNFSNAVSWDKAFDER